MEKGSELFGPIIENVDIRSSLRPFFIASDYRVTYPAVLVRAIDTLYRDYNERFRPLVESNREWDTDYQYAFDENSVPLNFTVQVDIAGLDDGFFQGVSSLKEEEVVELVRRRLFEIENSIAMYQIFGSVFEKGGTSVFKKWWRAALDDLRARYNKPIALLACTHQKYAEILAAEFDKTIGEALADDEVRELSGFDRVFGPDEFRAYLETNHGACDYLLYVRSSDPLSKLRKPMEQVAQPLLGDAEMRRIIKMNAITFNVDNPNWPVNDVRRINDTKAYMPPMHMALSVGDEADIYAPAFLEHLAGRGAYAGFAGERFSHAFVGGLQSLGVAQNEIKSGGRQLHFKPMIGTYGCYGHIRGSLSDVDIRRELRKNMRERGPYIVQEEIDMPAVSNGEQKYVYMDRIFLSLTNGVSRYLGGFRMLMPADSQEARSGRHHGSRHTVWAEIQNESGEMPVR